MSETGIIVRFPSGERVRPAGPDTVSGIVDGLYRGLGRRSGKNRTPGSVAVRLEALSGITDETISRLSALATAGSVTPETAARLALRHAGETGIRRPRPPRIRGVPGLYDIRISGVCPTSFAVRIAPAEGRPWVGSARATSLGRLVRVSPGDCRAICLLVGSAEVGRTTVRLVTTPSWQATLIGRSTRPGWRTLRHLLVVGGLPSDHRERSTVAAAVAHRLGSNPDLMLLCKEATGPHLGARSDTVAVQVLQLLAIAMPGLLPSGHDGFRP